MVINPTLETMVMSVISQLINVIAEFITIFKIRKYRGLHEGHNFILMAMEMHNTPRHDDALPSPGENPLEGSPKCSCGKVGTWKALPVSNSRKG
jgi:hypothetical protein